MNHIKSKFSFKMTGFYILLLVTSLLSTAGATTHIIQFGGSFFHSYNPNTLAVTVGDTVIWKGNGGSKFIQHSLQSDTIPDGAEQFGPITTGTSFSYVVKVPGYYHYICIEHQLLENMVGNFTAAPKSSVQSHQMAEYISLSQNFPNPFKNLTVIRYSLKRAAHVNLSIFTVTGEEAAVLLDAYKDIGSYEIQFDASAFSEGVYFYELHSGDAVIRGKMTLERFVN